jgi:RimJ/RimL family protein N-acetyltransferase
MLRPWRADDAPAVLRAIEASLPELQRWMDWARHEPEPVEAKRRRLDLFRRRTLDQRDIMLGVFDRDRTEVLGAIALHRDIGAGAAALGYWLRTDRTGAGLMTEAAAAVIEAGFTRLKLRRIEVHCDPANLRSAGVPRRLGFELAITIPRCTATGTRGPRDTSVWVMHRERWRANLSPGPADQAAT